MSELNPRFMICVGVLVWALSANASPDFHVSGSSKSKCGKIIKTYQKTSGETRIQLRPLVLRGAFHIAEGETIFAEHYSPNDNEGLALTAVYTYQGRVVSGPKPIQIIIESESPQPRYEKDRTLIVRMDGHTVELGFMTRTVQLTRLGFWREDLSIEIRSDQLIAITNAERVRLKLTGDDIDLTDCHLDALRLFANSIGS